MKLLELTLQNFMPYRGEQKVNFPKKTDKNVMVVFGENMRGKTSFLNAIRWCLYGQALDRDRSSIALTDIANADAREEGDWSFGVFLQFEDNGTKFDLRRTAKPRPEVHTPRRDSDFEVSIQLRKGDHALSEDQIGHQINQLLPEQISRFFLFDAELLAEYQDLVGEETDQSKKIKAAIEEVLGVPALVNGKTELRTLLKKAQDVLAKENRHSETMRSHSDQFSKIQGELETLSQDQSTLKGKAETVRSELSKLEVELSQTEGTQKLHASLTGLIAEAGRLKDRQGELKARRLEFLADAWKDVLQPRLRAITSKLESERRGYQTHTERRGELRVTIAQLKQMMNKSTCAVCGQTISKEKRDEIAHSLGKAEAELTVVADNVERVGALSADIIKLARISGTGAVARLKATDSDMNRIAVDQTRNESERKEIEDKIRGYDTAEIARQRSRRDHLLLHLGQLQSELDRAQKEIDERDAKKDQLSKLMSRAPTERTKRSAKEVEIYDGLEKLFAQSVDVLRQKLKRTVAKNATEAFAQLTTEKTYTGLQINDNYGLKILDRNNRTVNVRSAGAEQIVALSLIDGLNRTARKSGPIIIDTPLGRLDPKHRENVLRYVPDMADQVVLLVHEGEIDKAHGLEPLEHRLGVIYEIHRLSSSHSTITRVSSGH